MANMTNGMNLAVQPVLNATQNSLPHDWSHQQLLPHFSVQ